MPAGGKRPGAGRPKGSRNVATVKQQRRLSDIAKEHTNDAIAALVEVCKTGSDSARVAAANSILDRAYGKPLQQTEVTSPDGSATFPSVIQFVPISGEG